MWNKVLIGCIIIATLLGAFALSGQVRASCGYDVCVTDTCEGVTTTFTADFPSSVEAGRSFILSNITITPSTSYGVTVTSSTFTMTSSNTSPTSYSQGFSKTIPSPTTGHSNYTAYYPSWGMVATGSAGSTITVKLKNLSSQTQGFGTINCPLSKTFATIRITAPSPTPTPTRSPSPTPTPSRSSSPSSTPSWSPSSSPSSSPSYSPSPSSSSSSSPSSSPTSGGGSSSSGSSSSSAGSSASKTKSSGKGGATNTSTGTEGVSAGSGDQPAVVVPLSIVVKDSSGKGVKGAQVTLDGSQRTTTDGAGRAMFSNVLTGSHGLLVSYKGQKVSRNITLSVANIGTVVPVSLPASSQPFNPLVIVSVAVVIIAIGSAGAVVFLRRARLASANAGPPAPLSIHRIISGSAVETPPPAAITPAPAVSVFEPQAAPVRPAPWEPAPDPQPPVQQQGVAVSVVVPPAPSGEVLPSSGVQAQSAPAAPETVAPAAVQAPPPTETGQNIPASTAPDAAVPPSNQSA